MRDDLVVAVAQPFASFAGPTGGGLDDTAGRSGIWSPDGRLVVRAGRTPGEIARAILSG